MAGVIFALILAGVFSLGPVASPKGTLSERSASHVMPPVQDVYGTDKWITTETKSRRAPVAYARHGCRVLLLNEQQGVELVFMKQTLDGESVYHFVTITLLPNGVPSKVHYIHPITQNGSATKIISEPDEKDVIRSVCVSFARELPRNVQTLFRGYYGIGNMSDQ